MRSTEFEFCSYIDLYYSMPLRTLFQFANQVSFMQCFSFFMMEFLLWGLEANKKLNKYRTMEGFQFKDGLGNLLAGI